MDPCTVLSVSEIQDRVDRSAERRAIDMERDGKSYFQVNFHRLAIAAHCLDGN